MNYSQYENCKVCPRYCGVNRNLSKTGFCKETSDLRVASSCLHLGEEPPITGEHGSGTIFISGCNLHCAFCQNYQISQKNMGSIVTPDDFATMCIKLADKGAENINIVTGSHAIPSIADGLEKAKKRGLSIPVCWNTSSYETIESINMLDGLVDIWLPDIKTLNPIMADSVFAAPDYPKVVKKSIRRMLELAPLVFEEKNSITPAGAETQKMLSGVIIRHLVLPGRLDDTRLVLDWLKKHADTKACISLMSQYTPVKPERTKESDASYAFTKAELERNSTALASFQNRLINKTEFSEIINLIHTYDFNYLFYQELEENTEWLPDFTKSQPFSNNLAKPVWHWKTGFNV
ncbi:MAG: radical SAM protein [Treponema sp. CETP13]|nr:MAG: radical SAM protein [Treponema sp. CETP13]